MTLDGATYFLTWSPEGRHQLLSSVCPHLGSEIIAKGDGFECPHHGWRFDRETGKCLTAPSERMATVPVAVEDGRLVARSSGRAAVEKVVSERVTVEDLTVTLHAHACLEFKRERGEGFSLLTDPWLVGPAFLGAWTHYPPTTVDVESLKPDAIWISHEHSDHFHEPTLDRFARDIPIYVPDFPNRRMVKRLAELGFTRVTAMPFGRPLAIGGGITITCYEPGSLWNDAVVLIEVDGFRVLNLNDAGLNRRIASAVYPVDVIASSFTPGASGYPLTWTHLTDGQKSEILERARAGILRMLKEAVTLYGGSRVLPFAGHFALAHPAHEHYVRAMDKNTLDDVVRAFEGEEARVLDLMPGEAWVAEGDRISRRWKRRERLYEAEQLLSYLRRAFKPATFAAHHPAGPGPTAEAVRSYFLSLNRTSEIGFCEDLTFTVKMTDAALEPTHADLGFEVLGGVMIARDEPAASPNLLIEIPGAVLGAILEQNLSWDEAHIGYWCRFSRNPDIFHAGFWRLLQAPYFAKPAGISQTGATRPPTAISEQTIIADVLEKLGPPADRLLRRYGLYCAGCQHSTADSLSQGGHTHGLGEEALRRLVSELNLLQPFGDPTVQVRSPLAGNSAYHSNAKVTAGAGSK